MIIIIIVVIIIMMMIMVMLMIEDYLGSAVSRSWEPRAIVRPPRFHKSTKPSSLGWMNKMSMMLIMIMATMLVIMKMIN